MPAFVRLRHWLLSARTADVLVGTKTLGLLSDDGGCEPSLRCVNFLEYTRYVSKEKPNLYDIFHTCSFENDL